MTDFPTFSYTSYPVINLKPEKGTPFGWSLPVKAIIGSTAPGEFYRGLRLIEVRFDGIPYFELTRWGFVRDVVCSLLYFIL